MITQHSLWKSLFIWISNVSGTLSLRPRLVSLLHTPISKIFSLIRDIFHFHENSPNCSSCSLSFNRRESVRYQLSSLSLGQRELREKNWNGRLCQVPTGKTRFLFWWFELIFLWPSNSTTIKRQQRLTWICWALECHWRFNFIKITLLQLLIGLCSSDDDCVIIFNWSRTRIGKISEICNLQLSYYLLMCQYLEKPDDISTFTRTFLNFRQSELSFHHCPCICSH